jgi:hypothetical protein
MLFSLMSLTLLLGCPEPVDFSDRTIDNSSAQATQSEAPAFQSGTPSTTMPSDQTTENSVGAPPSMGTFAADLPESEIQARFTQEELASGATLRGMVNCLDCTGQLLVRALPPPPEDPSVQTMEGMQLITQVVLTQAGNFSMQVPDQAPVILQVVDDSNSDGIPSQGERMGMREEGAVFADGIVENIALMVGIFPKRDPIEGLGVIPTPPLPEEEGEGAMPADMVATPMNQGPVGAGVEGGNPAPGQIMPLGEGKGEGTMPPPENPSTPEKPPLEEGAQPPKDE